MITIALAGCDIIKEPIPPGTDSGIGGDPEVKRKVLLEEFTGHRCNNCPSAHAVAQQLSTLYGERLVVVSVHATSTFAAPLSPPASNGSYSTDFRTPAGDAYTDAFGVSFLPTGIVSRKPYNSTLAISQGSWGSAINAIVDQPADHAIWFEQLQHNAVNSTVSTEVKIAVLKPVQQDHKLTVYLVEDNVVDWQLNAQADPPNIPNYVHRHVLRTNLNGTWGVPAVPAGAAVGDTLTFSYTNVTMDPAWNPANCYLVAFVYNGSTDEVMQVEERSILP